MHPAFLHTFLTVFVSEVSEVSGFASATFCSLFVPRLLLVALSYYCFPFICQGKSKSAANPISL
jgi:hypothetical protein